MTKKELAWIRSDDKEIYIDNSECEKKIKNDDILRQLGKSVGIIEEIIIKDGVKMYRNYYDFLIQQIGNRKVEIYVACMPKYMIKTKTEGGE